MGKFRKRQRTSSREYWTFNGVTLHHQLETETGRTPRKHKLAVRIHRDEPSSRLLKGSWYVHAHQIKILVGDCAQPDWRKLRTNQLVSKLRTTFGNLYHPRRTSITKFLKHSASHNVGQAYGARKSADYSGHVSKSHGFGQKTMLNPSSSSHVFPWPMQAPSPSANPAYYTGQVPLSNQLPPTTAIPTHTMNFQQPLPFYQRPPCFVYPRTASAPLQQSTARTQPIFMPTGAPGNHHTTPQGMSHVHNVRVTNA